MADPQAYRLYEAQWQVFGEPTGRKTLRFASFRDVERFAAHVVGSDWWSWHSSCDVELEYQDLDHAYAHKVVREPLWYVVLPRWAWNRAAVIHELAHVATPYAKQFHGPAFARTLLDMHFIFGSKRDAARLREAFDREGVRYAT